MTPPRPRPRAARATGAWRSSSGGATGPDADETWNRGVWSSSFVRCRRFL
uniref:Uncharacterized protein n=1 Tax=Arundo donax TaxID=35708 RepID=A0A0A8YI92_ARUDO